MIKQNLALLGITSLLILQIVVIPQVDAIEVLDVIDVGILPIQIALNPITNTIYATNLDKTISVIDGTDKVIVSTIDVGTLPRGIAVNPTTNTIYVTNPLENTVSVIDGTDNVVVDTIEVGTLPRGIAVNPTTNLIYVTNPSDNVISVIDGTDNVVVDTIEVGTLPRGIAVNPTTNTIYVTNPLENTVSVIDGTDKVVVDTIEVANGSFGIAVNPTTNLIYVVSCFYEINTISVIDGSNNSMVNPIAVNQCTGTVGINPLTNTIYVPNSVDNTISVIGEKIELSAIMAPQEPFITSESAAIVASEGELMPKVESPVISNPIQITEESIQNSSDILPYFGIIITGAIVGIVAFKKRDNGKPHQIEVNIEPYEKPEKDIKERKLISQKLQERLSTPEPEIVRGIDLESIIENKIQVILKLEEYNIGSKIKLEAIKNSLTIYGSFTKKDNDYIETKYEEYKKIALIND